MRDADTGALVGDRARAAPADARRRAASRTRRRGGARSGRRWAAAGVAGDVDAISVGGQQHGMVVLDAGGAVAAAGQALERHGVGARRRLAARRSCLTAPQAWAAAVRDRCRWRPFTDHEAVVAAPQRARRRGARLARVLLPARLARPAGCTGALVDRPRRRVGHGLLVAGDAASTGCDLLAHRRRATGDWSDGRARGARPRREVRRARGGRGRRRRAPATTWPPRSASACGPGDVADLARHVGHRLRRERHADGRRRRAPSPASPTPPVASSRSSAR